MERKAKRKSEIIREQWPRITVGLKNGKKQFQVDSRKTGYNGGQEWKKTKGEAEARVKEILADFKLEGTSGKSMDSTLRAFAIKADEILKPFGKSILQAAEHYRDYLSSQLTKENSRFIGELADEWLNFKESGGEKKLRDSSISGIRKGRNFLRQHFKNIRIMNVDSSAVKEAIDKNGGTLRTKHNIHALISQFFNWAIAKPRGFCKENPCDGFKYTPEETSTVILTPEKANELMMLCEKKYPSLVIYHALQLFAGLRPDEARKTEWKNISENFIYIPKSISKVKDDRNAPITPTLKIWLHAFKGEKTGFVTRQTNFSNVIKKFRFDLGYAVQLDKIKKGMRIKIRNQDAPEFPQDCCRHSYASYSLAQGAHKGDLAEYMGNSIEIIKKHYKKVVPKEEADKFFSIVPCQHAEAVETKRVKLRNLINRTERAQCRK